MVHERTSGGRAVCIAKIEMAQNKTSHSAFKRNNPIGCSGEILTHLSPPATIKRMSMVVVGSVAYDGVETPHGKIDRMLGGSCTYVALSASFFTAPKIVAVVGDDFAREDEDLLASRGIDL